MSASLWVSIASRPVTASACPHECSGAQREWRRLWKWLILGVVLGAAPMVLAQQATDFPSAAATDERELRLPAPGPIPRTRGLPFAAWDMMQYFSTVLEMSAEKGMTARCFLRINKSRTSRPLAYRNSGHEKTCCHHIHSGWRLRYEYRT
ncbi:MAG: hypothetical protein P4L99_06050 [Chthoniobacter sp.]|nr:hypothetical protein [Chthoniobacter sp.]